MAMKLSFGRPRWRADRPFMSPTLPYTWNAGKTAHVHVRLVSPPVEGRLQPTVTALRMWRVHERINVKRATAEEGKR
jgi:hypothetical protein